MSKIVYWSKGLSSLLLLAAFGLQARGEYVPPATLDELLKADCVAVGRFTKKDGTLRFLPGRILRGEANIVEEAIKRGRLPISTDTKGRLLAHQWGRDLGGEQQDASASALWFFSSKWRSAVQPLELTEGFEALLGGKRPNATFRLLQHLDFDLRREALEELFAKPDKKLVAELHAIAERTDSQLVARAIEVLIQTRLLDVDRFWSKWLDHPARYRLQPVLQARDADRVTTAMLKAIATEKQPARLAQLLYDLPKDRPAYVEANLRHLGHAEETVRQQVVWNLYNLFWSLASQSRTSAKARDDITALARRALPLLEARLKEEKAAPIQRTLAQLVAKQDGVAWVFRVPTTYEPLPPYSDIEEMKVLIARLTSSTDRGFVMESAGRELAERFFTEAFDRLKAAAASRNFNPEIVHEGMGYLRDPRVFGHLVDHVKAHSVGARTYAATIRAIGRQNDKLSFGVLAGELVQGRFQGDIHESAASALYDALGCVSDKRALDVLKDLEATAKYHSMLPYVRARARHGDPWALKELLTALDDPEKTSFLRKGWYSQEEAAAALVGVDTAEATAALKRYVRATWPTRVWGPFAEARAWSWQDLENYAGPARRSTPIGELARREPRWLAEFALEQMGAPTLLARGTGAAIFRQLTGRLFDYKAAAFASERVAPLKRVAAWWAAHKMESREAWLLSYFRAKGFAMTRLGHRESLPTLVRALGADFFTHNLAVEQISALTGHYFTRFLLEDTSYRGQEQMTVRVVGWLRARQMLPAEKR